MSDVSGMINILVEERNKTVNDLKYKIQNYENEIHHLRSENSNFSNIKNNLMWEISSIKNQLCEKNNLINNLKNRCSLLTQEKNSAISNLSQKLNSRSQIISQLNKLINQKDQIINEQKSKIELLKYQLKDCKSKIYYSEQKINQLKYDSKKKEWEDIGTTSFETILSSQEVISVRFISQDGTLDTEISCSSSDKFKTLEEKLYQLFPHLKNENNFFISNGKTIQKDQTINFNQINPESPVMLIKIK